MKRKSLLKIAVGVGVSVAIVGLIALILGAVSLYNYTYRLPAPVVASEDVDSESASLLASSLGASGSAVSHLALTLETCGCESHLEEDGISCQTRRQWSTNVLYNPTLDHFAVTYHAHDQRVIEGEYHLIVNNPHTLSATLVSIYVGLEEKVGQNGNAPNPVGEHWRKVANAVVTLIPSSSCPENTANLCSGHSAYAATSSPNSRVILDSEDLNVPTTLVDNDGDGVTNEDGGRSQSRDCLGSLRSQDDDFDGRVDEDGECEDTTRFLVSYSLAVTADQAFLLSNQDVRIRVLATFLTGRSADATCSTDVDCSGGVSLAEKTARTVEHWTPMKFPTVCPVACECANVSASVVLGGDPIDVTTTLSVEDIGVDLLCADLPDPVVVTYTQVCPIDSNISLSATLDVHTRLVVQQECLVDIFGQQPSLTLQGEDSIVLNCSATV